jgi:hypothetical protein
MTLGCWQCHGSVVALKRNKSRRTLCSRIDALQKEIYEEFKHGIAFFPPIWMAVGMP